MIDRKMIRDPEEFHEAANEAVRKHAALYGGVPGAEYYTAFDMILASAEASISDEASPERVVAEFMTMARAVSAIFLLRRGFRLAAKKEVIDASASDIAS